MMNHYSDTEDCDIASSSFRYNNRFGSMYQRQGQTIGA